MVAKAKDTEVVVEIENCRAFDLGLGAYAECQCSGPNDCPYSIPFGYAFLCRHPRVDEIMQRSGARPAESSAD